MENIYLYHNTPLNWRTLKISILFMILFYDMVSAVIIIWITINNVENYFVNTLWWKVSHELHRFTVRFFEGGGQKTDALYRCLYLNARQWIKDLFCNYTSRGSAICYPATSYRDTTELGLFILKLWTRVLSVFAQFVFTGLSRMYLSSGRISSVFWYVRILY